MGTPEGRRISELRRSGASGKHLNKGKRSMQDQWQRDVEDEEDEDGENAG